MDEDQLRIFVGIVQKYFESETGKGPDTGSPYLGDVTDLPMLDLDHRMGEQPNAAACSPDGR